MLVGRLTRLGDDLADDFTGNAIFLEWDVHHEIDSLGSKEPFVK